MNLNMIRPKVETEDVLLSITKKCETLIKQTHTKAEETLEFKINTSRERFNFSSSIRIDGSWMLHLISLEVNNPIFIINTTNNKFELHTDIFDEFSLEEIKGELEENFDISDITLYHLQSTKWKNRSTYYWNI